ncbi:LysR family transcriptional regulator [Pseudomonas sp. KSR10]|uniref:LysR family transcriptional regulator n=1 Tax=Pseudomonas sp. KSR10 TaxID=2916654 RepID=UPI001EF7FA35|nr:LysR family transcriptional regulator [Pseudomonas sp. KSR10]MCG6541663.1 LysR family transcriptional regulator [Pseudomonas sp. KSR10]
MNMYKFTLQDLLCFEAVVREGSFQAAAAALHRSHTAVFAALRKLERQFGVALLDRAGYRVCPTQAGLALYDRAQHLLQEAEAFSLHAQQLAMGEETGLRVVIGDLCPRPQVLGMLSSFFAQCPGTRLQLHFEAVTGPWERLFNDEADLILHRIDKTNPKLEWVDLGVISLIPVVAPGFLPFPQTDAITPEQMRGLTQCILRDTAHDPGDVSHFVIDGSPQCTVADHSMKAEVVLQGMAWGHLPLFMIEEELRNGRLISIAGRHFPGVAEELVASRRRDRPHGPVAMRLWKHIQEWADAVRS